MFISKQNPIIAIMDRLIPGTAHYTHPALENSRHVRSARALAGDVGQSPASIDNYDTDLDTHSPATDDRNNRKVCNHIRQTSLGENRYATSPPPSQHQLQVLKFFKVQSLSGISRAQAACIIKRLFSDPLKVEQWRRRPATSRVKQGILFMGGQLSSNLTQLEAQSILMKYSLDNPQRLEAWRQAEYLFRSVNDSQTLKHYASRKLTWYRFFKIYDHLKDSGVDPRHMTPEMLLREANQLSAGKQFHPCSA
jgi:hypothetical protein